MLIEGPSRGRKFRTSTERQERGKAKEALCNCKRVGFVSLLDRWSGDDRYKQSQINIGWTEEKVEGMDVLGSDYHTYSASSGGKSKIPTNLGTQKRTQMVALQETRITQERQRVAAADPSARPDIQESNWQQQQSQHQQGSRVRLQAPLESETAGRNPARDDVWHSWWNQSNWNLWPARNQGRRRESQSQFDSRFFIGSIGHQRWQSFNVPR